MIDGARDSVDDATLQIQNSRLHARASIGRKDVDAVRPGTLTTHDFRHRHIRLAADDLHHVTLVSRQQVGNDHERHPGLRWQVPEQFDESFHAAR